MDAGQFWRERPAFEAYCRSKGLSSNTLRSYIQELRQFHRWFISEHGEDAEITARRIRGYVASRLERGNTHLTARASLIALRAFFGFLIRDEMITEQGNPMRLVESPRGALPEIQPLSPKQIHHFLETFDKSSPVDHRNFVMCLLILDTGLRIGEVATLNLKDITLNLSRLRVNGKGGKTRFVYLGETMVSVLSDYIDKCRPGIANGHGTLFPPSTRSTSATMQSHYLSEIIRKKMDRAGIPRANSSAHRLRHTFAVNFLRGGGGVFHLQKLLGHSTLTMTKRYVMLADDDLREAHRKASPVDRMGL